MRGSYLKYKKDLDCLIVKNSVDIHVIKVYVLFIKRLTKILLINTSEDTILIRSQCFKILNWLLFLFEVRLSRSST